MNQRRNERSNDRSPDRPGQRPAGTARRSGNPAVRAGATSPSPARSALARRSRRPLARLAALPRWIFVAAVLALVLAGLLVPGATGGALLLVVVALLGWLVAVSWPAVTAGGRANRILVIALLIGYAGWKLRR